MTEPLLVWRPEFEIGIASVDFEHRHMVDLINDLVRALELSPEREKVEEFLGEIHAGISAHFALEEQIMRELRYDQYEDHKADHERLLDEIRDIMDEFDKSAGFDYRSALRARLAPWFTDHFKTKDARFHKMTAHRR